MRRIFQPLMGNGNCGAEDYERAAKDDPRFEALLLPDGAPTPLAGNALIVVDSSEAPATIQ